MGSTTRSQLQAGFDSSVADGSISWLLEMPGLTDLTGTNSSPFNVEIGDGTPRLPAGNPSTYDGTSDLDWWYDPDGSGIHQLPASFTGGTFNAGPGAISLTMNLGGPSSVSMSSARIRAVSGPSSTPLESTNGFPPGHLPEENVPDSLTSFESMSAGQLAGNISARSLADTPIPAALAGGGMFNCSQAYTSANTMLDVLVGGCTIIGTQIQPTQPDRAAVDGDVYTFTTNTSTKRVTGCTRNGSSALLDDCLAGAAYSSYFKFTTNRVIVLPVTTTPPTDDTTPPPSNTTPGGNALPAPEFARTLSIAYSGKQDKFKSKLASEAPACIAKQSVAVYEKKRGKDPKLGSATTTDAGGYSLKQKNADGKFYSAVKQTSIIAGTCLAAKSKTIKVG